MFKRLSDIFNRERNPLKSVGFSFSRFFNSLSIGVRRFICFYRLRLLMLDNIANLWKLRDEKDVLMSMYNRPSVRRKTKVLNQTQTIYERKTGQA